MRELEEVAEHAAGQVARSQNLVYTLPHSTESIAEFLTPILARIDLGTGGTQVVVVTRDAETALTISETTLRLSGPAGIEVVPITSASRAGRIFRSRPVFAVAGPAKELEALVQASLLKLDKVPTEALPGADAIPEEVPDPVAAVEAHLGEATTPPRTTAPPKTTPPIENLIERYARRARRVGAAETEAPQLPPDYELP